MREKLRNKKHEVKHANSCTSAIGLWKKYNGGFDCIILDLNINPAGLENEETDKYFPIHGILVLSKIKDIEISRQTGKTPEEIENEIWKKTIVYSAYINNLMEKKGEFMNFNELKLVRKERDTSISDLVGAVTDFLNGKE